MRSMLLTCITVLTLGMPGLAQTADAPASQPAATQPVLSIPGLPAGQWLNVDEPVASANLHGRLWGLGVLEPWSARSTAAAADLEKLADTWRPRGVEVLLVTVAPAEKVTDAAADLPHLPIGTDSVLPELLPLEPLPRVYLLGPDQAVVWSGPADGLADVLPGFYQQLTPDGLTRQRQYELTNRLNRAKAAAGTKGYFTAVGLAATVARGSPPAHPLHQSATDLLQAAEMDAQDILANARGLLDTGKIPEAWEKLRTVAEGFYGRPVGRQALEMLDDIRSDPKMRSRLLAARYQQSAEQALQLGRQARQEQRLVDAERYYRIAAEVYPQTQAARQAREALKELHADQADELARQRAQPEAPVLLRLAARDVQIGRFDQARRRYRQVIDMAPGTDYARQAREALDTLPADEAAPP